MTRPPIETFSDRQQREIDYHREFAASRRDAELATPITFDVVTASRRRWWNAYWHSYSLVQRIDLSGKNVLVAGCGFGHDAIRLSKLGALVYAFDISSESLAIARKLASRYAQAPIDFQELPAESIIYPADMFDLILAVDILHHVDIPSTLAELRRVAKPGCVLICDEVYTHTWLEKIRRSRFVDEVVYPRLRNWMHHTQQPYVTTDERKLNESDLYYVRRVLAESRADYFNLLVGRGIPDHIAILYKLDRLFLQLTGPFGYLLGGRVVISGVITK